MFSSVINTSVWQGRIDALPYEFVFQQVKDLPLDKPAGYTGDNKGETVLLGFECDEGVKRNLGRPGAAFGPDAFRQSFGRLPTHRPVTLFDAGNVTCNNNDLESAQIALGEKVSLLLEQQMKPVVIGGGHETAWGHFQGIYDYFKRHNLDTSQLAILNFDAHFDCRSLIQGNLGSSGTPFYQVNQLLSENNQPFNYYCAGIQPFGNPRSLFEYAHQHNIHYLLAEEIQLAPRNTNFVEYIIDRFDFIYVTICMDVFNASVAPGVSAPQVLGIYPEYVIQSLRKLRQSGKVISLDIVELSPDDDIDQRTAKLAAGLAAEYIL